MGRTLTSEHLQWVGLFEKVVRVPLKDCFEFRGRILFLVPEGKMEAALGKNKENLLKLERLLKRKLKIVEFHPELLRLIENILAPLKVTRAEVEDGLVTLSGPDTKTRGLMIGSRAKNLRELEGIVRVFHPDLKEIRVV